LGDFKRNKSRILVATDVASRGIDVDQLPFVINFDMPENAETYVHRIGRTGRAGAKGKAISFCCEDDRDILHEIEKHLNLEINKNTEHPFVLSERDLADVLEKPTRGGGRSGGPSRGYKGNSGRRGFGGGGGGGRRNDSRGGGSRGNDSRGEYRGGGDARSENRGEGRTENRSEGRSETSGNRGGSGYGSSRGGGYGGGKSKSSSSSSSGVKKKFFSGAKK
jgi:ATP-dependent RNA helicase RhlE